MSSELGNRWDAGFHVLRKEFEGRAALLAQRVSADQALAHIRDESFFPMAQLRKLSPLCRGGFATREPDRSELIRAAQEYPHLALAILLEGAKANLSARRQALEKSLQALDQSESILQELLDDEPPSEDPVLSEAPSFEPIPEDVLDAAKHYQYLAGLVYFSQEDQQLVIPAVSAKTAYVADCWTIPVEDWKGEQTLVDLVNSGECPMPVRVEDLPGEPIGFVQLPDHTVNYGRGWRV